MVDDSGGGDGGPRASTKKSLRPEIQLYRPGMLRKGDSNKSLASDERPPRPENLNHHNNSGNSSRRRSNDTDSVTSRNGSGSTTPDANAINEQRKYPSYPNRRNGGESSSYNSTQSLYDTRQSGGYVRGGGSGGYSNQRQNTNRRSYPSQNFERNFNRHNQNNGFNDRASMRSEGAITKRNDNGRRRRNDSINSTQSEMPQTTNDQLHIDTSYESASQCGASSAYSMDSLGADAMSFEEMCASMKSLGSLDWSKEVENEFAMKIEREEQEAKRQEELKAALEAESQSKSPPKNTLRVNRNNKLQDSNGYRQRSPRNQRNRRNHQRDESDRESSFGGSIAEEEGEEYEDELKSGERTPTSTKDAFGYEPKQYGTSRNNENKQQRSNRRHEERRYRGEHDDREDDSTQYDALSHMTSGRLAGRISIVKKEPEKQHSQQQQQHSNSKVSRKYSEPMIKKRNENDDVKIKEICEKIQKLTPNVARKRDLEAAKHMVELSMKLAELYSEVIFGSDIVNSFTNGVEQNLFRNAFHKPIDCFRTGSNSASPEAKLIRATFQRLLLNGIEFYERLVEKYEREFDVRLDAALVWRDGFPDDIQLIDEFVALPCGVQKYAASRQKTAIKSMSRHLISLGDLHRYKTLVDGSENYETSQSYYLKSAQLWPSTGHSYNQLGVVAYYSMLYRSSRRARLIPLEILSRQRQTRVIDEIFFLTRAVSCAHPYAAAKERLAQRLGAMRTKVSKYEPLLDAECGKVTRRGATAATRTREIWINAKSGEIRDDFGQRIVGDVLSLFMQQAPDKLHRRAVSYLTDTFGMLVTKIGMDHFESVAERAFALLYASLKKRDAGDAGEFTARQLVQLAAMFIYAVHFSEAATSAHLATSLNTLITFFAILVASFFGDSATSATLLLPALNLIATWILRKIAIFEKCDESLSGLSSTILKEHDVKSMIEEILRNRDENSEESRVATRIEPEIVYVASFCAIFDAYPSQGKVCDDENWPKLTRIANIYEACAILDKFVESPVAVATTSTESPQKSQRDTLLDAERRKRDDIEIVVRPESVVVDSNVLIDHLDAVRRIFDARQFQLLIPTIVLSELGGLTLETASRRGDAARLALTWLRELAKSRVADGIATLTSQGNRIRFVIAFEDHTREQRRQNTVNDDTILEGCLKLAQNSAPLKIPQIANLPKIADEQSALYRTTVLLTEDRGLAIKATSQHMPCMDICRFTKWAGL